ncbi:MAG: hypothetical protein KC983_00825, partial [Phycisphaerales bacterium]|nr:hypothetical protein [Phycisphaerales bacterium]
AIGYFYARMSWQGEQAYYTSARTAHEAKMGGVLSLWQLQIRLLFLVVVPVLAYVMLTNPAWSDVQTSVGMAMNEIEVHGVREQMRVPLVLADVLPPGVRGIMAAMMLAAFISTHNTYLHSWGSILIQDIVLPMAQSSGWHPSRVAHLRMLRCGVVGVALFAFGFSAFVYNPQQPVILYMALTGSLFVGWAGAVIIGGLYWARGTCAAAWVSAATGVVITTTSALAAQMNASFRETGVACWGLADGLGPDSARRLAQWLADHAPNGQQTWGLAMSACTLAYVGVSLLGRQRANLDWLLHRGSFELEGEVEHGRAPTRWGRVLAFTPEFTRRDRIIFIVTVVYILGWFLFVVGGSIWAIWWRADDPVTSDAWLSFWHVRTWVLVVVAAGVTVWLTIGGIGNLRTLLRQLETQARDDSDDGLIDAGNSARNLVHDDDGGSHAAS